MTASGSVFSVVDVDGASRASKAFNTSIIALVAVSIGLVVLDTFDGLPGWVVATSRAADAVITGVFCVEYALRAWTSPHANVRLRPAAARLRYLVSPSALIDMAAILPSVLAAFLPVDLRLLRILRLLRLVRVLKFGRYSQALATIFGVIRARRHQLTSSFAVIGLLVLVSSILLYEAEHDAQPDVFENAFSGMWWAVATLTTVGYGDIYPVTAFGKLLGTAIAMLGIALVAIPTGIISAGFIESGSMNAGKSEKGD